MLLGACPTGIVSTTLVVSGSMRETVPSSRFVTQTPPAPTATSSGLSPTGIVRIELALDRCARRHPRRRSRPRPLRRRQPCRWEPSDRERPERALLEGRGIEPLHVRVRRVGHPDRAVSHHHVGGSRAGQRRARPADAVRIDAHELPLAEGGPDPVAVHRHTARGRVDRPAGQVDRVGHDVERRVDARELPASSVRHPDGFEAAFEARRGRRQRDRPRIRPRRRRYGSACGRRGSRPREPASEVRVPGVLRPESRRRPCSSQGRWPRRSLAAQSAPYPRREGGARHRQPSRGAPRRPRGRPPGYAAGARPASSAGRGRAVVREPGVLAQDGGLELAELGARLQPELVAERTARRLVGGQSLACRPDR